MKTGDHPLYVDIDGTLTEGRLAGARPVPSRLARLRELIRSGVQVVVWSGGGTGYARDFCKRNDLQPMAALGKPAGFVDDSPTIRPPGRLKVQTPEEFFR